MAFSFLPVLLRHLRIVSFWGVLGSVSKGRTVHGSADDTVQCFSFVLPITEAFVGRPGFVARSNVLCVTAFLACLIAIGMGATWVIRMVSHFMAVPGK